MTLTEWYIAECSRLRDFFIYWDEANLEYPAQFPVTMQSGDWDEQFALWEGVQMTSTYDVGVGQGIKHCPECKRALPISSFTRNPASRDGVGKLCTNCSIKRHLSLYGR